MNASHRAAGGLLLIGFLALPPVAGLLEADLPSHMLVQMPLLALGGWFLGPWLGARRPAGLRGFNAGGVAGILLAAFTMSYWMLPRAMDGALSDPRLELAKFLSLPLLLGLPLAWSWSRLGTVGRAFVWANLISMLAFLGWLYLASPVRLCNNYRVDQQTLLGWMLLALAAVIAVLWAGAAFVGDHRGGAGEPDD